MTTAEIIKLANKYNNKNYPEDFYLGNLKIIEKSNNIDNSMRQAITNLLWWKLNKIRSHSEYTNNEWTKLDYKDKNGNEYYLINGTAAHKDIILKASSDHYINLGIKFRNGEINYNDFKQAIQNLVKTKNIIILPIFYIHIWCPNKYPIFDINVWLAYIYLNKKQNKFSYKKPSKYEYYELYINFFNDRFADKENRIIDKGLWVLGDSIKKKKINTNIKRESRHNKIFLPYANNKEIDVSILAKHIQESDYNYIIQGQKNVNYNKHTKPSSLDYWLRGKSISYKNTKQATNDVLKQLEDTDIFIIKHKLICPDSGRKCKGLILK